MAQCLKNVLADMETIHHDRRSIQRSDFSSRVAFREINRSVYSIDRGSRPAFDVHAEKFSFPMITNTPYLDLERNSIRRANDRVTECVL